MTPQEQLAQSAHSAQLQTLPPGFVDFWQPPVDVTAGAGSLLGNAFIQIQTTSSPDVDTVIETYRRLLNAAQPAFKLAVLKRQKFAPKGRRQRIAASLAALNAAQPTDLTLAEWKEIVEEVEDED